MRLRRALLAPEVLVLPGAYDALTARLVARHGFEAVYLTGAGTTNAQLALPDIGLLTLTEMAGAVARAATAADVPLLVDADTGYGSGASIQRAVRELDRAGAGGIQIEDQVLDKRCGHLDGKTVVASAEMAERIELARVARLDPDLVLVARTDAAAVEGVEGALRRAHAYVDAGADAIFVEALGGAEDFEAFARRAPEVPLIANMTEFGKTPLLSSAELGALGYAAVLFPMTAFRLMLRAVDDGLAELAREGTQRGLVERMATRDELYEVLGYDPAEPLLEPPG
ncbi:MAG TPA: isocitrate lyase/phosphoenolpyruvate mutase family protein [Conexibacter sp.]|nr:isocitrate lyase/phosphoenolpyruvate mutase family protein [Conexibacter sp.]